MSGEPSRPSRSIPMLVEAVNALANRVGKAQLSRDIGASGAARQDQLLGNPIAVLEDGPDRFGAATESGLGGSSGENEVNGGGEAGAYRLVPVLERPIVRIVKLADARRITRAAEVFQQDCVVEVTSLTRG